MAHRPDYGLKWQQSICKHHLTLASKIAHILLASFYFFILVYDRLMNKYICKSTVTVTVTIPEKLFIKFIIIFYMITLAQLKRSTATVTVTVPILKNCLLN